MHRQKRSDLCKMENLRFLVTDVMNKNIPVYGWYNYKHSFSKDLIINLLKHFDVPKEPSYTILDPFCGAGTTLLAAKEYGITAIGVDIMPFPIFVSEAKTYNYEYDTIAAAHNRLENYLSKNACASIPSYKRELLKKYFSEEILDWILIVRQWIIRQKNAGVKYFFYLALFSILEKISLAKKGGGFLRIVENECTANEACNAYYEVIARMLSDVKNTEFSGPSCTTILGDIRDARMLKNETIDMIITSPPYPNRHDYTRIYSLESILGFSSTSEDIKQIRYKTLRSHVEARARSSNKPAKYKEPVALSNAIAILENTALPNKQIIPMLRGYFEDMHEIFMKAHKLLKSDRYFTLVVCDVRYGGEIIPVTELLNELAKNVGFVEYKILTARTKNNSAQQMKEYGKQSIPEKILIWQK